MDASTPIAKREPEPAAGQGGKFAELGVSGLKVFSGILDEEFLRELKGDRGRRIYRQMAENDPTVGAVLFAIELLIRAVEWHAEPADDSEQAKAEAEFAESLFKDMSHTWEDFVCEVLSMLVYGWAYMEVVIKNRVGPEEKDPAKRSKYDDGRIGIRKLAIRSQDTLSRWEMQDDGGIAGMWQQPDFGKETFIPIERALLFRTKSRRNSPEGVSILRTAYRPWFFLTRISEYEAIAIEREGAGLPIIRIPGAYLKADAAAADKAFAEKMVKVARDLKFNQQGGVVIPSDLYEDAEGNPTTGAFKVIIELLKGGGQRAIDTTAVKQGYKQDITRSVLADFLMLGSDSTGSWALSSDKTSLFLRACGAILGQIAAVLNDHCLPRIWAFNNLPHELKPTLVPGRIAPADLAKLGAFLKDASAAGMPLFPDPELENYVRGEADLPEKSQEAIEMEEAQREHEERMREEALRGTEMRNDAVEENGGLPVLPPGGGGAGKPKPKPKAAEEDEEE